MIAGGSKCCFAGGEHGPCEGRLEFHHCIKQQRLRRQFPYGAFRPVGVTRWWPVTRQQSIVANADDFDRNDLEGISLSAILGDTRNRVWLCHRHHELVTNGRLKVELPESVYAFADEFGLRAQLENDLRRAA